MGSYYNIDAILTDAQKVPCTFDLDIPGLGYLDENPGGDVNAPITFHFPHPTPPIQNRKKDKTREEKRLTMLKTDQIRYLCVTPALALHPPCCSTSWTFVTATLHA